MQFLILRNSYFLSLMGHSFSGVCRNWLPSQRLSRFLSYVIFLARLKFCILHLGPRLHSEMVLEGVTCQRPRDQVPLCCICLVPHSCLTLSDPMDCSPPGSSVQGILQTCVPLATPFSSGLPGSVARRMKRTEQVYKRSTSR